MLPILHLNGYKIAAPTVLARIPEAELLDLFNGYGYHPVLVSGGFDGEPPSAVHARMALALDGCLDEIGEIQRAARRGRTGPRDRWPMLILETPKGWTGPKDGGRPRGGGHVPQPSGPPRRGPHEPRAPRPARGVDAELRPDSLFDDRVAPSTRSPASHHEERTG